MEMPNQIQKPRPGYRKFPERLNLAQEVLDTSIERGFGNRPALIGHGGTQHKRAPNVLAIGSAGALLELNERLTWLRGRHTLTLRVADYQESKNMEDVARILPNTRSVSARFVVR